jgi:hypothetical protein
MSLDRATAELSYTQLRPLIIKLGLIVAGAVQLGLLLAAVWIFAAFSLYLSRTTGGDWFARSGSIMCLVGAIVAFRLVGLYQSGLQAALKHGIMSVAREIELSLEPPKPYTILAYVGYLTGVVGTVVWGYGDLLLRVLP